jgi:hypothetical protein
MEKKQRDWYLMSVEPNLVVFGYHGYRLVVCRGSKKGLKKKYRLYKGDRLIVSGKRPIRIAFSIAIRRLPLPACIVANLPRSIVSLVNFFNFLKNRKGFWWSRGIQ